MSRGRDLGSSDNAMPRAAVARLSLYLRQLEWLLGQSHETVSSIQLGQALEITDAQVRKDLAYFGQFGHPGVGYRVEPLRDALKEVLGTNRKWPTALVGVGNLGRALLGYRGFKERGFEIVALFDKNPEVIGTRQNGMAILPQESLAKVTRRLKLQLAILAVPAADAEVAARAIVDAGITGILNFAPVPLKVPEDVSVVSVDLGLQLEQLVYQVNQRHAPPLAGPSTSKTG